MMKHSSTIKSNLYSHIRHPYDECTYSNNVQYIISAEFDNKLGPIIKHQYPKTISGFKHGNSSLSNLAHLMIPNNIESNMGKWDFTFFVLYKNKYTQNYQFFPFDDEISSSVENLNSIILEEEDENNSRNDKTQDDLPLFFINVVNTVVDNLNDRGAAIKSIALGTFLKNFLIFKPILTMVLDQYMSSNIARNSSQSIQMLIDCFNMINSLDLSIITRFHSNVTLQNILNSISDDEIISEIFDLDENSLKNLLRVNKLPEKDGFGNTITFKRHYLEYQFSMFKPSVLPDIFTKIPLQIDLINYDPIKIEINYNDHVLKFLTKFLPSLSRLSSDSFQWKLMINSTDLTNDKLCQFVFALSNFINCFNFQYYNSSSMIIIPYMDISIIDDFRAELSKNRNGKFFTIVGVSNPIFELQKDVWDFYYDLDSENLMLSDLMTTSISDDPKNMKSKKMFSKNSLYPLNFNSSNGQSFTNYPFRTGLLLKFINYLIEEHHDNQSILNVFKRINILQLLNLMEKLEESPNSSLEILLKDEYMIQYKDFILFPEFFEYSTLTAIKLLHDIEINIQILFFAKKGKHHDDRIKLLKQVYQAQKNLYKFISASKINLGKFLNVCLNYPVINPFYNIDLLSLDFNSMDLNKKFENEARNFLSIDGLCSEMRNSIDFFSMNKSLNLIALPLFLGTSMDDIDDSSLLVEMGPPPTPTSRSLYLGNPNNFQLNAPKQNIKCDSSLSIISSIYQNTDGQTYDNNLDFIQGDETTTISTKHSSFSQMILQIKRLSVKILYRLDRHHIGRLLLKRKLNPLFQIAYRTSKDEYFPIINNSSFAKKDFSPGSQMTVSPNRKDMINNLNIIGEKQDNLLSTKESKSPINSAVAKSTLLESLNRLDISKKTRQPNPQYQLSPPVTIVKQYELEQTMDTS